MITSTERGNQMNRGFTAKPEFFNAMDTILAHPKCSEDAHTFISGIVKTVKRTGYVSPKQGKCAGGTYKAVVNNGQFIKHDWWY